MIFRQFGGAAKFAIAAISTDNGQLLLFTWQRTTSSTPIPITSKTPNYPLLFVQV
jgi:hypothetical protein